LGADEVGTGEGHSMSRIEAAAVRIGKTVHSTPAPGRHWILHKQLGREGLEGFVDADGAFHTRAQAAKIALDAGQVTALKCAPYLVCEDIF
jgi:hypothetical protein